MVTAPPLFSAPRGWGSGPGSGSGLGIGLPKFRRSPCSLPKSPHFADSLFSFYILPPAIQTHHDDLSYSSLILVRLIVISRTSHLILPDPVDLALVAPTVKVNHLTPDLYLKTTRSAPAPLPRYYILLYLCVLLSSVEQKGREKAIKEKIEKNKANICYRDEIRNYIDQCI